MNTKDKLIKLEPMPVESEYASSKQRIASTVRNTEEIILTDHYLQNKGYSKLQLQDKKNILELLKNEHEILTSRLRIIEFSISDINTNWDQSTKLDLRKSSQFKAELDLNSVGP